jgi:hypothetical protein
MRSTHQIEMQLVEALRTIRSHWGLMQLGTSSASNGGSPSSDVVTGVDRRVSLAHEVTLILNGWARIVVEDRGVTHWLPLGTDTLGLVAFLERHAQWMSGHEAAQDCADEIATCARKVKLTAVPPVKDWISIGECPICEVGDVRAYPGCDPTCQACGIDAVWSWWEKRMRPDAQDLVSAEELVGLLYRAFGKPIKPTTIRQWVSRGLLEPRACALDTRRSLYDREDAILLGVRRHAA